MSDATLQPATIADLKQYILATKGMFGALHLKHVEEGCSCEICKLIKEVIAELK